MSSHPVIYLSPKFPVVSETFVSDQLDALLRHGVPVHVLALTQGNSKALLKDWQTDPRRRTAFTILYPSVSKLTALKAFAFLLPHLLLKPSAWAYTLRIARTAPGIFAQAVLYGAKLRQSAIKGSLLVCHFGTVGHAGNLLRAWGLLTMPQVSVFHGYDISSIVREKGETFYAPLFNAPGHTSLTITKFWQNRLRQLGDPNPQLIKLGVDLTRFTFTPRTFPKNRPVRFISVGRLTAKKGYEVTLRALAALPANLAWEYHIVGGGPLGPTLGTLAAALGIAPKITFHGAVPHADMQQLLEQSDAFILASHTAPDGDMEALPIALLEAAATGLPVVTSTHSAIPEFFRDGENGLMAPEADIPGLTARLQRLLNEPKLWPALTRAAHADMATHQDFTIHIRQFIAFLTNRRA